MQRKIKSLILGLAMLALVFQPVLASADVSAESVSYLKAAGQTPWVTLALAAANATGITIDHLKTSDNTPLEYAKTILAVTAVNQNPHTFGNVDYVSQLKGFYQNNQIGDTQMLMDDSFGILALAAAGESSTSTEITGAKNYLLANQNTDGGWGYNVGVTSDTNSTAIIVVSLIEAGVSNSSTAVSNALTYLASAQNNDGGFGWATGNDSDTDSTSWAVWAIRKVGQTPGLWQKGSNNPLTYIDSMKNSDGSYGRTATSRAANIMATQDAVIALSEKTLPLIYWQSGAGNGQQQTEGQYLLRIEGPNGSICDKHLDGTTPYDLLVAGQSVCNYTFTGSSDSGPFWIDSIGGIENNNPAYWMYLYNNVTTNDALNQYTLKTGDEVLIYYDVNTNSPAYPDYDRPLKISVNSVNPQPDEALTATVQYYNNGWLPLSNATVFGADKNYTTDANGQVSLTLPAGYYTLYAEKNDFIRSNQTVVAVGDGVSQNVGLQVEIDQAGRGRIAGDSIIFEVTPSQLNFGKVQPGQASSQNVTLSNSGTVNLNISTSVSGDSVFASNLKIDSQTWANFTTGLTISQTKDSQISLTVPSNYIGSGIKTGELIFWAQPQ